MSFDLPDVAQSQKTRPRLSSSVLSPCARSHPRISSNLTSPCVAAGGMSFLGFKSGRGNESPIKKYGSALTPSSLLRSTSNSNLSPTRHARATSFGGIGSALVRDSSSSWTSPSKPSTLTFLLDEPSDDAADSLSVAGLRCRSSSNMSVVSGARCRSTSFAGTSSPSKSPLKSHRKCFACPLPQADVEWLLSTLSIEELTKFDRNFFLNDSRRRFRELDVDGSGQLGAEKLQGSLVNMFPTLKLDLNVEGHHMAALDKSLPSLIATFDSDADGFLDFEDFVKFVKFQQAWRAQFFLSGVLGQKLEVKTPTMEKSCSLPSLTVPTRPNSGPGCRDRVTSSAGRKGGRHIRFEAPKKPNRRLSLSSVTSNASDSTRCSSAGSQTRCQLDSSRGAFYSTMAGMSTSL